MRTDVSAVLLAALIGIGGISSFTHGARGADSDDGSRDKREAQQEKREDKERREYRQALKSLQLAREVLSTADGGWQGRRGEALTQTDYAIEQVYAGLGDDPGKDRDRKVAARELEQGREKREDRTDRDSVERRRKQMDSALDHLRAARADLTNNESDNAHRRKALAFTEQAIRDIQTALTPVK